MSKNQSATPEQIPEPLDTHIPHELKMEIHSDASIDECLTLARLYLKRAKELSNSRKGLYDGP